jgi:hypothetical protein
LFQLRNRDAEASGERSHRFAEVDLVLQLDELEHVAADAAAEAVEEALVLVDGERRRFLAVKGTEALVLRARLAQRHGVRDDGDNISRGPDFVDEGLRKFQGRPNHSIIAENRIR